MTRLYLIGASLLILICVTRPVDAQTKVKNIKLADLPFTGGVLNPSVAASAKHPGSVVVAMPHDRTFYSVDAGKTWTESKIIGALNGIDPAVVVDVKGDFHYLQAVLPDAEQKANPYGIVTRVSYDKGASWTEPVWVGNPTLSVQRKPRAAIHNLRGNIYATWTEFDVIRDTCYSNIKFSMSSNDGKRWSDAVQINHTSGECDDNSKLLKSAGTVLSTENKLFTAWSSDGRLNFDRSFDQARTWLQTDVVISKVQGGSTLSIPALKDHSSEPVLAIDNSISFFRTSLYMVWADQTNGKNDTDIWMLRSTMRGDIWSLPLRVNPVKRDKHQFMPWIAVDEYTGIIYVAYYDRSEHDDSSTDVYLAYSVNGGKEFKELKVSESSFTPVADKPFTEHLAVGAFAGVITIAWARQESDGNSLWVAVVDQKDIISKEEAPKNQQIRRPDYINLKK